MRNHTPTAGRDVRTAWSTTTDCIMHLIAFRPLPFFVLATVLSSSFSLSLCNAPPGAVREEVRRVKPMSEVVKALGRNTSQTTSAGCESYIAAFGSESLLPFVPRLVISRQYLPCWGHLSEVTKYHYGVVALANQLLTY